ncbi:hypothetical protein BaRGS_00014432, partial [Batillaria attramentaria]
ARRSVRKSDRPGSITPTTSGKPPRSARFCCGEGSVPETCPQFETNQAQSSRTVSTNYKAEAEALQTAATTLEENRDNTHNRVVISSDALSVLQALLNPRNKDLNTLAASLTRLQQSTEHTTIQWIP